MNLHELSRQEGINGNHKQNFIASKDFECNGITVLKESLVYFDGERTLEVVRIPIDSAEKDIAIVKAANTHEKVLYYSDILDIDREGVFHRDEIDMESFKKMIIEEPELTCGNITFSALLYHYDILEKKLTYFINTKPIVLEVAGTLINLPEILEVQYSDDIIYIKPVNDFYYHGVRFNAQELLQLDYVNGILQGNVGEEFRTKIINHPRISEITISKHFKVKISQNGLIFISLFSEENQRLEDYQVTKE